LSNSLKLGSRLGVLKLAIGIVPRGLDDLVSPLAGSMHHLVGLFCDCFTFLPNTGVGLIPFGA